MKMNDIACGNSFPTDPFGLLNPRSGKIKEKCFHNVPKGFQKAQISVPIKRLFFNSTHFLSTRGELKIYPEFVPVGHTWGRLNPRGPDLDPNWNYR
jgi:hypothetical protein